MDIGLFGGTFNPIHNGHVALATRLLKAAHLDEVWLLVTPQNPWKAQMELLDDDIRLLMARAAVEGIPGLVASDYEFHLPRPSYTWDTLQALSRDFPDHRFTLLIGGDNWEKFGQWYAHDKILENHDVAIYPRKGYKIDRAALPPLVDYWVPGVTVSGLHELVANALVMKGEIPRTMDLRQEDLPFPDEDTEAAEEA